MNTKGATNDIQASNKRNDIIADSFCFDVCYFEKFMTKADEYIAYMNFNLALYLNGLIDIKQHNKIKEWLKKTYGKYLEGEK